MRTPALFLIAVLCFLAAPARAQNNCSLPSGQCQAYTFRAGGPSVLPVEQVRAFVNIPDAGRWDFQLEDGGAAFWVSGSLGTAAVNICATASADLDNNNCQTAASASNAVSISSSSIRAMGAAESLAIRNSAFPDAGADPFFFRTEKVFGSTAKLVGFRNGSTTVDNSFVRGDGAYCFDNAGTNCITTSATGGSSQWVDAGAVPGSWLEIALPSANGNRVHLGAGPVAGAENDICFDNDYTGNPYCSTILFSRYSNLQFTIPSGGVYDFANGNLSLNSHKVTGLLTGTAASDAVNVGQLQVWRDTIGGRISGSDSTREIHWTAKSAGHTEQLTATGATAGTGAGTRNVAIYDVTTSTILCSLSVACTSVATSTTTCAGAFASGDDIQVSYGLTTCTGGDLNLTAQVAYP